MSEQRESILAQLGTQLEPERIRHRDAGRGRTVPYLEGHDVISRANAIFGFDGWSYRIDDVAVSTTTLGRIFYRASVTVEALGVRRHDVGIGIVETDRQGQDLPGGHETAIKGAATDALKRALRTFGAQFGNDLYDKSPAPAPAVERAKPDAPARSGEKTVGQLLEWARREHGLTRGQVLEIVGVTDAREITDLALATRAIQAWVANKESSE